MRFAYKPGSHNLPVGRMVPVQGRSLGMFGTTDETMGEGIAGGSEHLFL